MKRWAREWMLFGSTDKEAETVTVMLWMKVTIDRLPLGFQLRRRFRLLTAEGRPSSGS